MESIIEKIREELFTNSDEKIKSSGERFFKEEVKLYGLKSSHVARIGKDYFKLIKDMDKTEILLLCEELWKSGYMEESFIVSNWAHALSGRYEQEDLVVFRHWIDTYITNWASCDGFCNHTMGSFIEQYPEYIDELKCWTQSQNRWMRRAAAVSLIVPAKQGKFLKESLEIADRLLTDTEDIVQKGYGWLLKEVSRKHTSDVFSYVMKNKRVMPRTALRYAIELMPKDMKAEAMKKNW